MDMERIEVFKDGGNIWIKIPGEMDVSKILARLLLEKEPEVRESMYLEPEPKEDTYLQGSELHQVFPMEEFVPVEEMYSSLDLLKENGPKELGPLYQTFRQSKSAQEKEEIKKAIAAYMFYVAKDGFDAQPYSCMECKEILKSCEALVFKNELAQIYEQAGVNDLGGLFLEEEIVIKGALTACMDALYKKVSKN